MSEDGWYWDLVGGGGGGVFMLGEGLQGGHFHPPLPILCIMQLIFLQSGVPAF